MDDQKENPLSKKLAGKDDDAIVIEGSVSGSVQINRTYKIENHYHLEQGESEDKFQHDINERRKRKKKSKEQHRNIFISYARADVEIVQGVYEFLLAKAYYPWMDIHAIRAGENWLKAIYKAIDESDIFLAILSNNSVSRRGVIQKELKKALDKWEGMLPDDIFIIPIQIDDCPIPELLKHIQVLNWNNAKSEGKLLEAISIGLTRREGA